MMELTVRLKFLLAVVLLVGTTATADEIIVAAAADLNYAFRDIAARFEKETGHKVNVIIGSSAISTARSRTVRHSIFFFGRH